MAISSNRMGLKKFAENLEKLNGKKPAATVKKGQDVISDKMSFGKAFRAARNEGMKTFTWRGKKYGTKPKSEVKKNEETKPAVEPAPAPNRRKSRPLTTHLID
jgi:hypothetical protein